MGAPKGNRFWEIRTKHGVGRLFTDPEALREACQECFDWYENNPLLEDKVGFSNGVAIHTEVKHIRALTVKGLTLFLGITEKTYFDWKKNRHDLAEVLEWAEKTIWMQKFGGAAAGLLNANIISRELGLIDKQDVNISIPQIVYHSPAGERPYPIPPIHGEGEDV